MEFGCKGACRHLFEGNTVFGYRVGIYGAGIYDIATDIIFGKVIGNMSGKSTQTGFCRAICRCASIHGALEGRQGGAVDNRALSILLHVGDDGLDA